MSQEFAPLTGLASGGMVLRRELVLSAARALPELRLSLGPASFRLKLKLAEIVEVERRSERTNSRKLCVVWWLFYCWPAIGN